jgi:HNH endonuclease
MNLSCRRPTPECVAGRRYTGHVPLIKRIQQASFEPYDYKSGRKSNRDYAVDIFAADKNLTLELHVDGFKTNDTEPGRGLNYQRVQSGSGTWKLSQASFELQMNLPLELIGGAQSPDLWSDVVNNPDGQLWLFQGWVYFTDDQHGLTPEDVRALVNVEENKRRLTLEKAHALQAMTENYDKPKRRESIPQAVRLEVWQRDGGRCVECNGQEKLEFDHIIPVAMGGGNTSRNLQLLCETCNRRKGASLG